MEAFNPFIPLNAEDSGIPALILRFKIKNLTSNNIKISVVGSMMNPIGFDGKENLTSYFKDCFGENINELKVEKFLKIITQQITFLKDQYLKVKVNF